MTMSAAARPQALLCVAVLLAYLNSLHGAFQFDDFNVIVDNPVVHSLEAWRADLGRGIRPLLKLTYTINWLLGGGQPLGFHVVNLAVHLANTLLVYALARLLLDRTGPAGVDRSAAAFVAALLFGLHPVQTEAVTYVSGRSSSLMALFYLGGLTAYVAASQGSGQRAWLMRYLLSPLLFGLALATKETAITFPVALLLWDLACRECRDWKALARRQAVHWAVWFAAVAALWLHPVYPSRIVPLLDAAGVYRNVLTQIDAVSYLLGRLLIVHPLNIDPDLRGVANWSAPLAAKAALLIGVLAVAMSTLRRRPWWSVGIFWFFLQLAPTNSVVPRLDLANERQLYLAGVGIFIALGAQFELLRSGRDRHRAWIGGSLAAVVALFAALVMLRNGDYASEIRLWEQTARASPGKPRAHNNLGFAYSAAGCRQQAEAAYRHALRLDPGYEIAQKNLASLLERSAGTAAPVASCAAA